MPTSLRLNKSQSSSLAGTTCGIFKYRRPRRVVSKQLLGTDSSLPRVSAKYECSVTMARTSRQLLRIELQHFVKCYESLLICNFGGRLCHLAPGREVHVNEPEIDYC